MKKWKILLVGLLILPMFWINFGCGETPPSNPQANQDFTVDFYSGMGEKFNIAKQEVKWGQLVLEPPNFPVKYFNDLDQKWYRFVGWYSDISCEDVYYWDFLTSQVFSNTSLFAKWEEMPTT